MVVVSDDTEGWFMTVAYPSAWHVLRLWYSAKIMETGGVICVCARVRRVIGGLVNICVVIIVSDDTEAWLYVADCPSVCVYCVHRI